MFIGEKVVPVFLLCALIAPGGMGKVLARWTEKAMPPAKSLGVSEIAIPWNASASALMYTARDKGYRVYLEATSQQAKDAAESAAKAVFAGLIIEPAVGNEREAQELLQKLRVSYPKLDLRILLAQGKQPQVKGNLVYQRNGVLQVSSPTAQPWVDSNLAAVRLAQAVYPDAIPLYSFAWNATDPLQKQLGPRVADYALAVAEAGAFHSDLILELPENLQKSLANGEPGAWATWKQVRQVVDFYGAGNRAASKPEWSVGVWTDSEEKSYEVINLMARHNIPFGVLNKERLNTDTVKELDVLVAISAPEKEQIGILFEFAMAGGTVVLVNAQGTFPWQSDTPLRRSEFAVTYGVGKGRVIEFSGAVTDPETFAQDIRRLMTKERVPVSLWNSLTMLVVPYRDLRTGQVVLEFVNYEEETQEVQVQVKGSFAWIRYGTPERSCCEAISPRYVDGFTEFVVPHLVTGGRVSLRPSAPEKKIGAPAAKSHRDQRFRYLSYRATPGRQL